VVPRPAPMSSTAACRFFSNDVLTQIFSIRRHPYPPFGEPVRRQRGRTVIRIGLLLANYEAARAKSLTKYVLIPTDSMRIGNFTAAGGVISRKSSHPQPFPETAFRSRAWIPYSRLCSNIPHANCLESPTSTALERQRVNSKISVRGWIHISPTTQPTCVFAVRRTPVRSFGSGVFRRACCLASAAPEHPCLTASG